MGPSACAGSPLQTRPVPPPALLQELLDLHRRYVHCAADDACSYGGRAAVRCAVDEALAAALMLAGRMASAVSAAGGDEGWAQVWTFLGARPRSLQLEGRLGRIYSARCLLRCPGPCCSLAMRPR